MHPVLFSIGSWDVGTHSVFVGLGVLVAGLYVVYESRRRGVWNEDMFVVVAAGLVGGALGMRASGLLRALTSDDGLPLHDVWQYGAKSVLGGLTGAYLGVLLGKRFVGMSRPTGDVFAPAVALGMAVGRVGCLLTEAPGRPTTLPWGIELTAEQAGAIPSCPSCAAGVPLHPSFVYEIVFHLGAFVWLRWLRGRGHEAGALLTYYLAAYALFRFAVEATRDNEVVWMAMTRGQLFLTAVTPLLLCRVAVLLHRRRSGAEISVPEHLSEVPTR